MLLNSADAYLIISL